MFPTGWYFWGSILFVAIIAGLKVAHDRGRLKVALLALILLCAGVYEFGCTPVIDYLSLLTN